MIRSRSAFTLIEVSIVLSVLALIWLCVASVLFSLHRADHRLTAELEQQRSVDRFARRLRDDSHASISAVVVDVEDMPAELILKRDNGSEVRYRPDPSGIVRLEQLDNSIQHRDLFRLDRLTVHWNLSSQEQPRWLGAHLTFAPTVPSREETVVIQAALAISRNRTLAEQE